MPSRDIITIYDVGLKSKYLQLGHFESCQMRD